MTRYLEGKKIIKIHKDQNDAYLWALDNNDEVFRINTTDKTEAAVEDWTSKFAAFSNLTFIDIAAVDQNNVFIATSSSSLLYYKDGNVTDVGYYNGNGIKGKINSIAMIMNPKFAQNQVLIGTDKDLYTYVLSDASVQVLQKGPDTYVYESIYRKNSFIHDPVLQGNTTFFTTTIESDIGIYYHYLWEGDSYGGAIRTTTFTTNMLTRNSVPSVDIFWGTANGMYQLKLPENPQPIASFPQRNLTVPVNKITDIYGLAAFGLPVAQSSMLAGTDKGFYYSLNYLNQNSGKAMIGLIFPSQPNLNLVTDPVYDIEVNSEQEIPNTLISCENAVWLATATGVYEMKPDYSANLPKTIKGIYFKSDLNATELSLCAGPIILMADKEPSSGLNIQWYKDGQLIPGATGKEYSATEAGEYYSVWRATCENISIETNRLVINPSVPPVITWNYPDKIKSCEGNEVTLKVDLKGSFEYRWYKDGVLLPSETAKEVKITDAGKYKVAVGSCGNWVEGKESEVSFDPLPRPLITASKPGYCSGDEATLSLNLKKDPSYIIKWYADGNLIQGSLDQVELKTTREASYTVSVENIAGCSRRSDAVAIKFQDLSSVIIEKTVKNSLCEGEIAELKVNFSGTVEWSTGETGTQISVTKSGTYKAKLTTAGGCETEISTEMLFNPRPVLDIEDVKICPEDDTPVTISAPAGFVRYTWNGVVTADATYVVKQPGTVTLTVEDLNGCTATREIQAISDCPRLRPSTVFTPNGDGINDTWNISGIENDVSYMVQIFNRNGSIVFQHTGIYTAWNGTIKGRPLPAGVYYYRIASKKGTRVFSGFVSILY